MSQPATIAAACAHLSTSIDKILVDVGKFARTARESRHHMNSIAAELFSIKTIVEILNDDAAAYATTLPEQFFDPLAGMLKRCADMTEQLERRIERMISDHDIGFAWAIFWQRDIEKLVARMESLKSTLDLTLDHVSLYTHAARTDTYSVLSPASELTETRQKIKCDTNTVLGLLKRNDAERKRIEERSDDEDSMIDSVLSMLRSCAETAYEESVYDDNATRRIDSLSIADEPIPTIHEPIPPAPQHDPASALIGAWLENITSQSVQDPVEASGSILSYRAPDTPKKPLARHISFFSLSSSAGSITTAGPRSVKSFLTASGGSLKMRQLPMMKGRSKSGKSARSSIRRHSPIPEGQPGEEDSERAHSPEPQRVRSALSKRSELDREQQVALDQALRTVSNTPAPGYVEQLLAEGADPNTDDPQFGTLFIRASYYMSADVITLMTSYGADFTKTGVSPHHSALHAAVVGRRLENVEHLAELGINIDEPNERGETPLHLAIREADALPIARSLLEWGADVNAVDEDGVTPLQIALTTSCLDSAARRTMVELLLAHGADSELTVQHYRSQREKGLSVLGLI